jgi:hypothetical protein
MYHFFLRKTSLPKETARERGDERHLDEQPNKGFKSCKDCEGGIQFNATGEKAATVK